VEVIRRVTRQGHPESTRLRQGESAPDLESVSRIWIWTPDTDDFQTLMGTFLSQDTSMMTVFRGPNCRKNARSRNVEKSVKKRRMITSFLSTDISLMKFS